MASEGQGKWVMESCLIEGRLEASRQSRGIIGVVETGKGKIRAMLSTYVWFPAQVYQTLLGSG